jgi:hypothetical protein
MTSSAATRSAQSDAELIFKVKDAWATSAGGVGYVSLSE